MVDELERAIRQRDLGLLAEPRSRGVQPRKPGLLDLPGGVTERLALLNQFLNPVEAIGQSMRAGERMMSPNVGGYDRLAALGDMLSGVAGVAGPAVAAGRAGLPAASAIIEGLLGFSPTTQAAGDTMRAAGRDIVDRLNQPGQMPTTYANPIPGLLEGSTPTQAAGDMARQFGVDEYGGVSIPSINRLDPNEWRTRLESSLPGSWLDPKFDKPQWHGISNVASELPPQSMQPILRSTGTLEPEVIRTIESLVGRTGIPALGDRSIAGNEILGVGNLAYANPVRSLGGADFMRESGTGIWANAGPQAQDLARTAEEVIMSGGDPALIFTAMGPQSADFSTMMAEAVMNQYSPQMIDPNFAAKYDEAVRKFVPGFTSILDPNFLDGLTGTDRWNLWQLMDRAELKRAGLPDINLARRSITDPRLMDVVPFDAGLTIGRPTGGLLSIDSGVVPHPTYQAQLAGAYEGGLERSIPGAILWRDFFNQRRASGASPGGDQRSLLMNANRIKQDIDQQTVDEANQFFEQLRGLNDPSSPMRLWRGLLGG